MIDAAVNLLAQLNTALGGNFGVTIIVIGILSRLIFTPLMRKQLDHSKKLRELQPKLNELKKKYKDKTELAQQQAKLFQESGVNPAAGCLPLIVQIAIFTILYNAITRLLDQGIDPTFLGWNLAEPNTIPLNFGGQIIPLPGLLIILSGLSQLVLSKMMMPAPVAIEKDDKKDEKEAKTDIMEDLAQAQSSMVYLFPLMFIVLGYRFPTGLALYWTVTTITAIGQQVYFQGWDELKKVIPQRFMK